MHQIRINEITEKRHDILLATEDRIQRRTSDGGTEYVYGEDLRVGDVLVGLDGVTEKTVYAVKEVHAREPNLT